MYSYFNIVFFDKNTENENFEGFSVSLCSGAFTLVVDGHRYPAEGDSLVLLSSGHRVDVADRSDDYLSRTVNVSLDDVLEFPSPVDLDIINLTMKYHVIPLDREETVCLSAYYDLLDRQRRLDDSAYRREITRSLVYALMLEICDRFLILTERKPDMPRPKQEILTDNFFRLMSAYYRTEHNVGFYAGMLNRTPKYLSNAIRKLSGRSVPDWIDSMLVRDIKQMLKFSDKTILEISEELNFSSPSVFIQFFRRKTGVTPLQYRKQG